MKERFGSLRISTFLSMIIGILFVAAAAITILLVRTNMRQEALNEAKEKMELILNRNLAVHTYFSQILKPRLLAWSEPFRSSDYFDASWMSSTYAVREMNNYFEALSAQDYYYKDAAINARNPDNEADAAERAFIEELKTNPSLQERTDIQTIDGKPYLVFMRSGEVLEESCLLCHGDPQNAPGDLVRQYGVGRSFHREAELGKVISAVSVRVPLANAYAETDRVTLELSGLLVSLLGLLFALQFWLSRHLVFAPLAVLKNETLEISAHEERLGDQIPVPFGEELGVLTRAFNTLSVNLRASRDHLEVDVQERTADLKQQKTQLLAAQAELQRLLAESNQSRRTLLSVVEDQKQAEQALTASEAELRALFASMQDVVLVIDRDGVYRKIAPTRRDLLIQPPKELLGKNLREVFPAGQAEFFIEAIRQVLESRQTTQVEYDLPIGGQTVSFSTTISARDEESTVWVAHDITNRKQTTEALEQAHERLRTLSAYWQNAIEAERTHIAREIHDEFGQSMTALKMDLTWLVNRLPAGDERAERIEGMNALVDDSITLMRRIATDLRPNLLDDLGLNAALEWQAHEFSRRSGIPCDLSLPPEEPDLDSGLRTTLFRIFQEILTNVNRHAQATRVEASFLKQERAVILTVQDNGRGISEGELESRHSLGLLGMRERAAQWDGSLTLSETPGKGTTVRVRIPLPNSPVDGGQP